MARVSAMLALIASVGIIAATAGVARAQQVSEPEKPAAKASSKKERAAARKQTAAPKKDGAAAPANDPAAIQASLEAAQKSLDAGKPEPAVNQVNALISAGRLDSRTMAKALSLRGQAYRRQGKPAQAISDLQSALWLKGGLGEADRTAALQARAEAYKEAGLGEPPAIGGRGQPASRIATATTPAAQSNQITTAAVPPASAPEPEKSSGGFFANLFGGAQKQAAPPPAQPKAPVQPALSSWSEGTKGSPDPAARSEKASAAAGKQSDKAAAPAAPEKVASATPAAAAVAAGKSSAGDGGKYRVQLGAMRSRAEAQSVLEKVKTEHGSSIGARNYEVQEAVFGNMGTFYRGRIGPFSDGTEPKAICSTLRAKGVDCMVTPN